MFRKLVFQQNELGFQSCKADPDVWLRLSTKIDGSKYYEYVLLYTDDILAVMEEPERFLREEFGKLFSLKSKSIGPPSQYLGNKVKLLTLENGQQCWSLSSSQYVQNAVRNVEDYCRKNGLCPLGRASSPWPRDYRSQSDVSPELSPTDASY